MRFVSLIAATLGCAAGLASADSSTSGCSTTTTTTATTLHQQTGMPTPSNPWTTSLSTANYTLTETVLVPSNTTNPLASITGYNSGGNDSTVTFTASTPTFTIVPVSSNVAAAQEGFAGDSSMMGLVVFFALSLCLL
ncbi:hypothetical protein BD289DRAFT_485214 [Coniella lustricola]|uniref:Uncharacterized protein n=1 Tax=Coniella lustricola TaxID=2025994 RepID=A0A2T2ZZE3_9PEZI|nr:hypothetical protein BD289DRAFT_485214 [Coniella lustricola]